MSAQDHWTRCDQEMPDVDTDVLIYIRSIDFVTGASWDDDALIWTSHSGLTWLRSEVTHWRQIPAPPLVLS